MENARYIQYTHKRPVCGEEMQSSFERHINSKTFSCLEEYFFLRGIAKNIKKFFLKIHGGFPDQSKKFK